MQEGKCCVRNIKDNGSYEERIIEYNKLEVYRVLKNDGRMAIVDIVVLKDMPA